MTDLLLPAEDQDWMAAALDRLRPATATLWRPTVTIDPSTHKGTDGWTQLGGSLTCWVEAESLPQPSVDTANRLMIRQPYIVHLPRGTDVQARDQIRSGGRTWEVIGVPLPSAPVEVRTRCWEVLAHA